MATKEFWEGDILMSLKRSIQFRLIRDEDTVEPGKERSLIAGRKDWENIC